MPTYCNPPTRMKPLLWCKTHKLNSRGLAPISLRITVHGVRAEHSTSIMVRPADWQQRRQKVKDTVPGADSFNDELRKLPGLATSAKGRLEALGEQVTAGAIVALLKNPKALQPGPPPCVLEFMEKEVEEHYLLNNRGTYESVRAVVRKLRAWHGPCPLPLPAFTPAKAQAFYRHLLSAKARGGEIATANRAVAWFTALYRRGVKRRIWAEVDNPFAAIEKKSARKRPKVRLTKEELIAIINLPLCPNKKMWRARLVYLMQFYLRGERVGAVLLLRWSDFDQQTNTISYHAQKNGPYKQVPVRVELAVLLDYFTPRRKNGDTFVLPFLPNSYDRQGAQRQLAYIKNAINLIDEGLKEVAIRAGVNKPLHSHSARHTFASLANKQVGIEAVQNMLGHSAQSITRGYIGEMENGDINEAGDKVFDSLL